MFHNILLICTAALVGAAVLYADQLYALLGLSFNLKIFLMTFMVNFVTISVSFYLGGRSMKNKLKHSKVKTNEKGPEVVLHNGKMLVGENGPEVLFPEKGPYFSWDFKQNDK